MLIARTDDGDVESGAGLVRRLAVDPPQVHAGEGHFLVARSGKHHAHRRGRPPGDDPEGQVAEGRALAVNGGREGAKHVGKSGCLTHVLPQWDQWFTTDVGRVDVQWTLLNGRTATMGFQWRCTGAQCSCFAVAFAVPRSYAFPLRQRHVENAVQLYYDVSILCSAIGIDGKLIWSKEASVSAKPLLG